MKGKWYSRGRLGRISIAWLLSVMMMVVFMPTFAFAAPAGESEGQVQQELDAQGGDSIVKAMGDEGEEIEGDDGDGEGDEGVFIEIEDADDVDDLWSDGTKCYSLGIPEDAEDDLWIGVGVPKKEGDGWEVLFTGEDNEEDYFTYDSDNQILTLRGDTIWEEVKEYGWVSIYANVTVGDDQAEGYANVNVYEASTEYDLPEDEDWPLGKQGFIERNTSVYVKCFHYPDGEELDLEVKTVESSNPEVVSVEEDDQGKGWDLRAEEKGKATITVTFEDNDVEDIEGSYSFDINVTDAVYEKNMWITDGSSKGLPGSSHEVQATAEKVFYNDKGEEERTVKNLSIVWSVTKGNDLVKKVDVKDPLSGESNAIADVVFRDVEEDEDFQGGEVIVKAEVFDGEESVADECREFSVEDDYWEVWPAGINPSLAVGESIDVTPELRHYALDIDNSNKYVSFFAADGVDFRWDYDDDVVSIEENENHTWTITRLEGSGTNLSLSASYDYEGGSINEDQRYWLFDQDCEMWFNSGPDFEDEEDVVYEDGDFTYTLETTGLPENAVINYQVVRANGGSLVAGEDYEINHDQQTVTLHGAALIAENHPDGPVKFIMLRATATLGEGEDAEVICRTFDEDDDDDWVVCRASKVIVDYHFEDTDELPGRDGWINGCNDMHVKNSAYPFGEDIDYEVTGVKITKGAALIGEGLADDGASLKKETGDEDDFGYYYRIKDLDEINVEGLPGEVTFKVSYKTVGDDEDFEQEVGSFTFTVTVVSDLYDVDLDSDDGRYQGLPGDEFNMTAHARHEFYDGDGEYQQNTEGLTYKWYYAIGSELSGDDDDFEDFEPGDDEWTPVPAGGLEDNTVAGFTPSQNEEGEPTGKLTFKSLNDLEEDVVFVKIEVYNGDKQLVADAMCDYQMKGDYYELLPYQIADLDVGGEKTINAEVRHYWMNGDTKREELLDNVHFCWEYDDDVVTVTDTNGEKVGNYDDEDDYIDTEDTTGDSVEFTIARHGSKDCNLRLIAEWSDKENSPIDREYWIDWIESDLWNYDVNFKNTDDKGRLFGSFGIGGVAIAEEDLADEIEVTWNGYVLDPKYYDLVIEYEQWDDEGKYSEMVPVNELTYRGANNSSYRVTAKAKEDSVFEGETHEQWIDICSNTSLASADVTFPEQYKGFDLSPMVDYYWFIVGERAQPTVTINGGEPLTIESDFVAKYVDENENELDEFPTTSGQYTCLISPGTNGVYSDGNDRVIIIVKTEAEMADAEAAIAEGNPVFKKIEKFFDDNCSEEYMKKVRDEYDALSDKAKAMTPSQLKWILHEKTGHFWNDGSVVNEATCTKTGKMAYACTFCDETKEEVIPKHKQVSHAAVAQTCTKAGNKAYWSCECGKYYADKNGAPNFENEIAANSWVVPAKGHKTTLVNAVLATAKADGNTAYYKCTNGCGKFFSDAAGTQEIQAGSWIVKKSNMTVKAKKPTAKANKKTVIKKAKAFTVKNAPGKVTFKKLKGDKKITVAKNGKVTVQKGLKKKKVYKVRVKVTSKKTAKYAAITKTVTLKIRIK